MSHEFQGVGWSYPFEWDSEVGAVSSSDAQDIQQAIWIILSTAPGERMMRPDFGCAIHDYVFAPVNTQTIGLLRFAVEEALTRWEPRIELEQVAVEIDRPSAGTDNAIVINIDYRVRTTDSRYNLVYPFYLQREEPS